MISRVYSPAGMPVISSVFHARGGRSQSYAYGGVPPDVVIYIAPSLALSHGFLIIESYETSSLSGCISVTVSHPIQLLLSVTITE
jgi:hypothetical protein